LKKHDDLWPGVESLQLIPLFHNLSDAQRAHLYVTVRRYSFRTGDFLMQHGRPSEGVLFIVEGTVKICRTTTALGHGGREVILQIKSVGALVGDAHLDGAPGQAASAIALETVICLMWSVADFLSYVEDWPVLKDGLMQLFSSYEYQSASRLEVVALHNVTASLAAQMLLFAAEYGQRQVDGSVLLPLALTQSVWAGLTGHSRENINKAFKRFQENGWIESLPHRRLLIRDCEALRRAHLSALPR
jgi:CRP-like cAMP-binding protein